MFICPAGHLPIRKARTGKEQGKSPVWKYYFDVEKCKRCTMKDGCYKEGAKTKHIQWQ